MRTTSCDPSRVPCRAAVEVLLDAVRPSVISAATRSETWWASCAVRVPTRGETREATCEETCEETSEETFEETCEAISCWCSATFSAEGVLLQAPAEMVAASHSRRARCRGAVRRRRSARINRAQAVAVRDDAPRCAAFDAFPPSRHRRHRPRALAMHHRLMPPLFRRSRQELRLRRRVQRARRVCHHCPHCRS